MTATQETLAVPVALYPVWLIVLSSHAARPRASRVGVAERQSPSRPMGGGLNA